MSNTTTVQSLLELVQETIVKIRKAGLDPDKVLMETRVVRDNSTEGTLYNKVAVGRTLFNEPTVIVTADISGIDI